MELTIGEKSIFLTEELPYILDTPIIVDSNITVADGKESNGSLTLVGFVAIIASFFIAIIISVVCYRKHQEKKNARKLQELLDK